MWFKAKRNKKKLIRNPKIFWYRLIPFVIAEIQNPEWEGLQKAEVERKQKFEQLRKIYNSNGNWYILEGLDYYWFGWQIFTNKEKGILYNDSCHLQFNEKPDGKKFKMLEEQAREDIDNLWNNFYGFFKREKKYCTCKDSHLSCPEDINSAKCVYCGKPPRNKLKKGFTLIELLVVIAIILAYYLLW